jgi:hypothetical protein
MRRGSLEPDRNVRKMIDLSRRRQDGGEWLTVLKGFTIVTGEA